MQTSVSTVKTRIISLLEILPPGLRKRILNHQLLKQGYKALRSRYRYLKAMIKPYKSARVFVRKGIGRMDFFSEMNNRNINYVLLRWWEGLPEMPEGEDMDILIKDEDRAKISDLITYVDNGTGMKCDIYTITGSHYGSHKSLPYYQSNIAHDLLENRRLYKGAYVPKQREYFASLAYHALFHKGKSSGLPGLGNYQGALEHDYSKILEGEALKLNLDIGIDAKSIFNWLGENKYLPAEDTLSKLVEIKPELQIFQKELYSDIRGGELMIFVIREKLIEENLLDKFQFFLENEFLFEILDVHIFSKQEKEKCTRYIRGGKWDKGPYALSGGKPEAFIVAFDYYPEPLDEINQKKQSRTTNANNIKAKYRFRDIINRNKRPKEYFNGVHSADNELDAHDYLKLLGEDYRNTIMEKVEIRRQRIARKHDFVKILSKNKNSTVELIEIGKEKAVKKTFRPGRENLFERELYAVKYLSRELNFIPKLIEEGDGYLITEYLPNLLHNLDDYDRKNEIAARRNEIIQMIISLHKRGFIFPNFTPDNLIITENGKLYSTGYSRLQKYDQEQYSLAKAIEVAGISKKLQINIPDSENLPKSGVQQEWASIFQGLPEIPGLTDSELSKSKYHG